MSECPNQSDITELTAAVKVLAEKIELVVTNHQQVVRWLLIVVCVIALGRSAIDLGKDFFDKTAGAPIALAEENR